MSTNLEKPLGNRNTRIGIDQKSYLHYMLLYWDNLFSLGWQPMHMHGVIPVVSKLFYLGSKLSLFMHLICIYSCLIGKLALSTKVIKKIPVTTIEASSIFSKMISVV